ncbi:MAG: regulatory protein RecX [Candidatus Omnitrophica bacterium]|nr:regulatory protein RecX [Candidatus Omnitrophota bacterium]
MEQDKKLQSARNNAYCLLRSRPRSESEMRGRLKLKRYDESTIDAVIESLKKAAEIDDVRFADFWVESRMHVNPVGDVVLRRELKEKGVPGPIIEAALEKKSQNYDDYAVALNMAGERFKRLVKLDRRKALKRLYDYLLRRGFNYDIVKRVIDAVMNENG